MKMAELAQKLQAAREVAGIRAAECNRLREINAELLAALKNIAECASAGENGANMDLWVLQAKDAIARAEGDDQ